ncbi:VTT domain-containing protein, partial [Candidatus Gracilibacteria bacterium]|nr:VTT domain-containing protein [Candidatus Gracilibacteria bacterium]
MLETLLSLVLIYTYPLIFIVGFLASFGIPLPATALFIASGAFVGAGYMEGYILFMIGWSACVLGDITGYSLMKRYGKGVWKTLGFNRFVAIETIEKKYGGHMETRGFLLIFTSRFLFTAIGSSVNILAGFMKTGWRTFL